MAKVQVKTPPPSVASTLALLPRVGMSTGHVTYAPVRQIQTWALKAREIRLPSHDVGSKFGHRCFGLRVAYYYVDV